jgi:Putative Ig domain
MGVIVMKDVGFGFVNGVVGISCAFAAGPMDFSSGVSGTVTTSISSGSLPPGMSLVDPVQTVVSNQPAWLPGFTRLEGTPTTPGTYTFNVHAVDTAGNIGNISQTLHVFATQISAMSLPRVALAGPMSFTFDSDFVNSCFGPGDAGTVGPWTTTPTGFYTAAQLLAYFNTTLTGLTLSSPALTAQGGFVPPPVDQLTGANVEFSISGFLGGNPHTLQNHGFCEYTFFVYQLDILPAPPNGTVGVPYSAAFVCSEPSNAEYTPTFTFTGSGGQTPPGLSFNLATGVLSGTPTTAGTYGGTAMGFFVHAVDQAGLTGNGGILPIFDNEGFQIIISPAGGGFVEGTHAGFGKAGQIGGGTK